MAVVRWLLRRQPPAAAADAPLEGQRLQAGRRCRCRCASSCSSTASPIRNGSCCAGRTGWSSTCRKRRFLVEPKSLKARGLITQRALRRLERGHVAADPDRQGAVRGRPGRRDRQRGRARASGWSSNLGLVGSQVRAGARRPGRDHRLDGLRRRRATGSAKAGRPIRPSASPWSSIPVMAASTAAPRAPTARSRRPSRWRSRWSCGTSSPQTGKYDVYMTRDTRRVPARSTSACASRASTRPTCSSRSTPTRSGRKGIRGATVYTVSDKASDAEAQALADRENLSDALAGIDIKEDEPRGRRHPGRSHPPRDAHLFGALCPLTGRRAVADDRADQQSAALGRLQGAAGARRAVGAGRARLSLQRQGRGAAARSGLARQGGRPHRLGASRCLPRPRPAAGG